MPNKAVTHIQNTAPGPPMAMAMATPATLPTPTRLAKPVTKAWNGVMPCASSPAWRLDFMVLMLCLNSRNCTPRVTKVKKMPTPTKNTTKKSHNGLFKACTHDIRVWFNCSFMCYPTHLPSSKNYCFKRWFCPQKLDKTPLKTCILCLNLVLFWYYFL